MKKKIIAVATALIVSGCTLGTVCGCTDGDGTEVPEHDCVFTNYVSNNNAKCYDDGTETAKCDICGVTNTRTEAGSGGHRFENEICIRCNEPLLNYRLSADGTYYTVFGIRSGWINYEKQVAVPAEYNGLPVKAVGDNAFNSFMGLESITFSDGMTEIGDYAFSGCKALKQVSLPDGFE